MALALVILSLLAYANAVPVVSIGQSTIIGTEFRPSKVEFFGGIPFAKPPVGELRLQPPVFVKAPPVKTLHADQFGFGCLQNSLPPNVVSEDCLTLNIFRPAGVAASAQLPVMVWIYGGKAGASSLYNATEIVVRSSKRGTPIIFASLNYRVGPLGFPQGVEAGQSNILNLGLQDQLTALEWIQSNIEKFGGDKSKVTVVGESAGAISINIHLMETKIRNFARAAILESTASLPTFEPEVNEAAWQSYVAAIPACASFANTANTFDCIRSADSQSLLQALTTAQIFSGNTFFQPVIDGPGGLLVDRPSKVVLKARLPTMIGSNLDEGALFTPQNINSTLEIEEFLIAGISPSLVSPSEQASVVQQILELYPDIPALGSPFGTGNNTFGLSSQYKRLAAIFGDFIFQSSRRTFTENMAAAGVKVFAYHFSDPDAILPTVPAAPGSLGITHSSEIFYVFGSPLDPTPTAVKLSNHMMDYWISFATSLNPNDDHLNEARPHWQQYTLKEKMVLELNGHNTVLMRDDFRTKQIAFFQNNPDVLHR
ncbi:hypothetical protein GALMADRAFT_224614 [Galerina marginata CBS 339.88]|uniref:Carboxylic ester hydrolase n=1 Tax=Galerina marginata (strain CBS 339.88) TaxID=685588 RepID=A0A067TGX3_GALM3|nr:hypothetical protein GALMADRAFT_224614 [Galerina marginata CBS 339.88]